MHLPVHILLVENNIYLIIPLLETYVWCSWDHPNQDDNGGQGRCLAHCHTLYLVYSDRFANNQVQMYLVDILQDIFKRTVNKQVKFKVFSTPLYYPFYFFHLKISRLFLIIVDYNNSYIYYVNGL